ncbi:MAG: signal peptidase II [Mariprofundaceae bacterium]|nr:signal peptidase II [Mariprofundaceae bacterium]
MNRTNKQIALFALLLTADQITKWWIEQQIPFFHMTVIDGFFNIVRAHNFGVAFSLFADWGHEWRTALLLGVTIGIAAVVSLWWWRERKTPGNISWLLILILTGAVGNIWDRLQFGYVVDFIDWYVVIGGEAYHWPAFNIADACISVSVVLLLLTSLKKR